MSIANKELHEMENTTQEFCVEARKGKLFANEWQPVGTVPSIETARGMRKDYEDYGYEARIMVREVTPWREYTGELPKRTSQQSL